MPSKRPNHKKCKRCGVLREDCGYLSHRGLCVNCSSAANAEAIRQIAEHSGPHFDHWRERMAQSVGGSIPTKNAEGGKQ